MTFALDRQIASHPTVFADVLTATPEITLDPERPIVFSGIGTSLHAARVAAGWVSQLTEGRTQATAIDAHHLALVEPLTGSELVVVISHRGYKRYPSAALEKARAAGAGTIAVVGTAAPDQPADHIIRTCENETAGTFSVSYLAALAALGRLAATLDPSGNFLAALEQIPDALAATLAQPVPTDVADRIAEREPLLLIGFGCDHVTVDEAALKIKEGAWMWAEAMSVEFSLHGTPAVYRADQAALVMVPDRDDGGRTATLLDLLSALGVEALTCGTGADNDMSFAITHPLLRPTVAIVPFQRLTAELARRRGTDPDTLHGHREPWKSAMTALTL